MYVYGYAPPPSPVVGVEVERLERGDVIHRVDFNDFEGRSYDTANVEGTLQAYVVLKVVHAWYETHGRDRLVVLLVPLSDAYTKAGDLRLGAPNDKKVERLWQWDVFDFFVATRKPLVAGECSSQSPSYEDFESALGGEAGFEALKEEAFKKAKEMMEYWRHGRGDEAYQARCNVRACNRFLNELRARREEEAREIREAEEAQYEDWDDEVEEEWVEVGRSDDGLFIHKELVPKGSRECDSVTRERNFRNNFRRSEERLAYFRHVAGESEPPWR